MPASRLDAGAWARLLAPVHGRPIHLAFDLSQAGPRKAGCGFYAAALFQALRGEPGERRYTLLGSFGDFVHQPLMALQPPVPQSRWAPRHLLRRQAERFWNNPREVRALLHGVDVLQANNFWCPAWPVDPVLVYTVHDLSFAEHPAWHRERNRIGCFRGMQRASLYADWFVAISEATRQVFLRHFPHVPAERVRVIHQASRFEAGLAEARPRIPRAAPWLAQRPYLLCTATIEPRKNQTLLLEVYSRFRARGGPALPLVFVGGPGWLMDDFRSDLEASPWAADLHWLGYVSDAELAWLYSHCLVNLYPSFYEGFGLPVLEGMGFGAPIICSDRTSLPEIVGDAGLLLPPDDPEAWLIALERLVQEPARRHALAAAGRRRAARFTWKASASALLALYEEARALKRESRC